MGRQQHLRRKRTKIAIRRKFTAEKHHTKMFCNEIISQILDRVEESKTSTLASKAVLDEIISNVITLCEITNKGDSSKCGIENDIEDIVDDEYNFSWGDNEEFQRIQQEVLCVEKEKRPQKLNGYRIVDIDFFLKKTLLLQTDHSKLCTGGRLEYIEEKRRGLVSTFKYQCNICGEEKIISTENPKNEVVNKAAVWGTLATGSSYAHLTEFLSVLDVPNMNGNMFFNIQRQLGYVWKESLWEVMEAAGKEEYRLALEKGQVDSDGVPYITVLLDGGWSKRSYGHTYNAASGVAVIIGRVTGKLLYIGVRNKFCSLCAKAENKGEEVKSHVCFKNWTGSSTSMEPDIIVEGFKSSINMHGLRYKKFIADGDSTVYAHIRNKVEYGQQVTKIECTNHCIKNYSKHLYNIAKDNKNISLAARKMLSKSKITSLVKTAQKAIYANAHGDYEKLKEDLRNSVLHVFGDHSNCEAYMCNCRTDLTENHYEELVKTGAHHHIYGALNSLISKSNLLIDNETNNKAELFMSILARFNMGKRLNLVQRESFQTRATLTGLSYNQSQSWHVTPWKKYFKRSPGKYLRTFIEKKEALKRKRNETTRSKPKAAKKLKYSTETQKTTIDYGPNLAEIELTDDELHAEVKKLIERLKVTADECKQIAINTVGQFDNPTYRSERMHRLTASNFGRVVKKRPSTSCDCLVRQILGEKSCDSLAIQYGKKNEIVAIRKFEEKTGKKVEPSGLFIDELYGFLGASPDGIISEEEILEVKCLFKVSTSNSTLKEAVMRKEVACMQMCGENLQLKKTHNYYYQIQGQLAISRRRLCYFVVYTGDAHDLYIEKVMFDNRFWTDCMLPKLITFFKECLGPEIILNRRARMLKCRDPPPVVEAQARSRKGKK